MAMTLTESPNTTQRAVFTVIHHGACQCTSQSIVWTAPRSCLLLHDVLHGVFGISKNRATAQAQLTGKGFPCCCTFQCARTCLIVLERTS